MRLLLFALLLCIDDRLAQQGNSGTSLLDDDNMENILKLVGILCLIGDILAAIVLIKQVFT